MKLFLQCSRSLPPSAWCFGSRAGGGLLWPGACQFRACYISSLVKDNTSSYKLLFPHCLAVTATTLLLHITAQGDLALQYLHWWIAGLNWACFWEVEPVLQFVCCFAECVRSVWASAAPWGNTGWI